MQAAISTVLFLAAIAVLIPTTTLAIELLASFLPKRRSKVSAKGAEAREAIAVVIPAHNEERGLPRTIESVKAQLLPADRLVVVADNCTDATADIARLNGAEVVVRNDLTQIGKGYALQAGYEYLVRTGLPPLIGFVDSDCILHRGALADLAAKAVETGAPVQALYLMQAEPGAGARTKLAEFAWLIRNHARPLGLSRLGLGCALMGSGMVMPSRCLGRIELATGSIAEDTLKSVDFALQGLTPRFCDTALVTSEFPASESGLSQQRARWIHGNLEIMFRHVLPLVMNGLKRGDLRAIALGIDLLVPPLTVLLLLNAVAVAMLGLWAIGSGYAQPFLLATMGFVVLLGSLFLTWFARGRNIVSSSELRQLAGFFQMVSGIVVQYGIGRRSGWNRSDRS